MNEILRSIVRASGAGAMAAAAGMLTRPCCFLPALLSLTGGSAAGLGQVFTAHHAVFTAVSAVLLTVSLWLKVRLQTLAWNRWLAGFSTLAAFSLVAHGFWF
jgi:hypothetical protein